MCFLTLCLLSLYQHNQGKFVFKKLIIRIFVFIFDELVLIDFAQFLNFTFIIFGRI
jgi:hypothetical protein